MILNRADLVPTVDAIKANLVDRIRRETIGMRQKEICELTGLRQSEVSDLLRGVASRSFSVDRLFLILLALDCKPVVRILKWRIT